MMLLLERNLNLSASIERLMPSSTKRTKLCKRDIVKLFIQKKKLLNSDQQLNKSFCISINFRRL